MCPSEKDSGPSTNTAERRSPLKSQIALYTLYLVIKSIGDTLFSGCPWFIASATLFVSAKYFENELMEFDQILHMY